MSHTEPSSVLYRVTSALIQGWTHINASALLTHTNRNTLPNCICPNDATLALGSNQTALQRTFFFIELAVIQLKKNLHYNLREKKSLWKFKTEIYSEDSQLADQFVHCKKKNNFLIDNIFRFTSTLMWFCPPEKEKMLELLDVPNEWIKKRIEGAMSEIMWPLQNECILNTNRFEVNTKCKRIFLAASKQANCIDLTPKINRGILWKPRFSYESNNRYRCYEDEWRKYIFIESNKKKKNTLFWEKSFVYEPWLKRHDNI